MQIVGEGPCRQGSVLETFKHLPHAPHRLYVDSSLTKLDMYSHYKDTFTLAGASRIVSRPTFARIVQDMNISFAKLGCELCETCLLYEQHNPKGTQCG